MIIQVTEDDIRNGIPGIPHKCAIARALKREFGGSWRVYLWLAQRIRGGKPVEDLRMTESMTRFIVRYDKQLPVKPFRFRVINE